jgi:hypothetical protein
MKRFGFRLNGLVIFIFFHHGIVFINSAYYIFYKDISVTSQYVTAPNKPVMGMVTIHAITIFDASLQRTMGKRWAAPVPTMLELMTWVVLTGAPITADPKMTTELASWDVKACMGRIR